MHHLHSYKNTHSSIRFDYMQDPNQLRRDMRTVYRLSAAKGAQTVIFRTGNPNCEKRARPMHFDLDQEEREFIAWCAENGVEMGTCREATFSDRGIEFLNRILRDEAHKMQVELQEAARLDRPEKGGPVVLLLDSFKLYTGLCGTPNTDRDPFDRNSGHNHVMLPLEADALAHALLLADAPTH